MRASTRRTYDSHLRNWILPALGNRSLQSLTPTDVRALVRVLRERLAPRTAWHVHGLLATILRSAVDDGWLARSACRRTATPKPRREPVVPLTVGQVQALLDALPGAYRLAGLLGAGCGLRVGEVLGLAVGDVDLARGVLSVTHQLQAAPGQRPRRVAPKSATSVRTVPLPGTVATAIEQHLQQRPTTSPVADHRQPRRAGVAQELPRPNLARCRHQSRVAGGAVPCVAALLRQRPDRAAGESVTTVQARSRTCSTIPAVRMPWPGGSSRTSGSTCSTRRRSGRGWTASPGGREVGLPGVRVKPGSVAKAAATIATGLYTVGLHLAGVGVTGGASDGADSRADLGSHCDRAVATPTRWSNSSHETHVRAART